MLWPKTKPRAEVRIKPGVYPQVAIEAGYVDERLENLGASERDRRMVAQGLASRVIGRVSAFSVRTRDGQTRDAVDIHIDHGKRRAGRHMDTDLSGRRSVTEQIDRADAALLKNEIGRFGRRGRHTEVEVTFRPDIYQNPAAHEEVSRALGTRPVTSDRRWKGGGCHEQARITPGRFQGVITTRDRTHNRRKR